MVIGSTQRLSTLDKLPELTFDNFPIKQVDTTKSLGVYVDEHLSWNAHIAHISKIIASGIGAIKRCRPFAPFRDLEVCLQCHSAPHFDYYDIVWENCSKTNATKLQKLNSFQ